MMVYEKLEEFALELLGLLEDEAANIGGTLEILNSLRAGVIKRDESALEELIAGAESCHSKRAQVETKRALIRIKIAEVLNCTATEVNLSKVIANLTGPTRAALISKKHAMEALVARLRTEYVATIALLSECSRLNKLLLNAILKGRNREGATYNASGAKAPQGRSGLVNIQF